MSPEPIVPPQLFCPHLVIQLDGTPLGGKNCTCAAGVWGHRRNVQKDADGLTVAKVRGAVKNPDGMPDVDNGTTFTQVDAAIASLVGNDDFATGYFQPRVFSDAVKLEGKAFLMAILYGPVRAWGAKQRQAHVPQSELVAGSETFGLGPKDWHAIGVHAHLELGESGIYDGKTLTAVESGGWVVQDSLNDGRRSTVGKGYVFYPDELMNDVILKSRLWGGRKLYGTITMPAFIPTPVQPKPPSVVLKFGGHKALRGPWRVIKPSYFRSSPFKSKLDPKSNVVSHASVGHQFKSRQTTDRGTLILGSRRWLGDATGSRWIHISRVKHV